MKNETKNKQMIINISFTITFFSRFLLFVIFTIFLQFTIYKNNQQYKKNKKKQIKK